jgi:parallel beta-helix repeat protein
LTGGGTYCESSFPEISECIIEKNTANDCGGGIYWDSCSSTISNCEVLDNVAGTQYADHGGGIYLKRGRPIISNCLIDGNETADDGGGMRVESQATIVNCIITNNVANNKGGTVSGGGVCFLGGYSATMINCTISKNFAPSGGGGIGNYGTPTITTIRNCIIWDNPKQEIYKHSGTLHITYSDVKGGWSGTGNIDVDPLFNDPDNGDFHLWDYSPCIDRGTDEGAPDLDFEGDPRWDHPDMPNDPSIIDMGADECAGPELNKVLVHLNVEETQVHRGDEIQMNVVIQTNFKRKQDLGQFWMMVTLPNQKKYGPIYGPYGGPVQEGYHTFDFDFPLTIPMKAPFGTYELIANAGLYPDLVVASDRHEIEIIK